MVEEAQRQRTTFPDAREQAIARTYERPSRSDQPYRTPHVDADNTEADIITYIKNINSRRRAYEGTGVTPQTFPDWVIKDKFSSGMINEWGRYGSGSLFGSPMWLDAGTKWKQNIPLMLRSLRQRDEFKDWSDDELTHYMHRTFSNRGGLMSLV